MSIDGSSNNLERLRKASSVVPESPDEPVAAPAAEIVPESPDEPVAAPAVAEGKKKKNIFFFEWSQKAGEKLAKGKQQWQENPSVEKYHEKSIELQRALKLKKEVLKIWIKAGLPIAIVTALVIGGLVWAGKDYDWRAAWNSLIRGKENTGEVYVDKQSRQERSLYYNDGKVDTYTQAERWANNEWTDYNAEDFFRNLKPDWTYNDILSFVDICGPQCFFDKTKFPAGGRPVIEEILGLTPQEYDYYSTHLDQWDSIKGGLIERLREKYPDDLWLPEMFNLRPTDMKSKQPSDFENWYNYWHDKLLEINQQIGVFNPNINSTRGRIQVVGLDQWKNAFAGQQNFKGAAGKGRGFGSSKGFS